MGCKAGSDTWSGDGLIAPLSGYLTMADGTRYHIVNGFVRTIRDRNGNKLSFTYDDANSDLHKGRVQTSTDSLGRKALFAYD